MDQELLNTALMQVKYNYCAVNWQNVVEYFGEETADALDFFDDFDYAQVLERKDLKECAAYLNLVIIQRHLILGIFDLDENAEAVLTYVNLEYWYNRLSDVTTGEEKALWLH